MAIVSLHKLPSQISFSLHVCGQNPLLKVCKGALYCMQTCSAMDISLGGDFNSPKCFLFYQYGSVLSDRGNLRMTPHRYLRPYLCRSFLPLVLSVSLNLCVGAFAFCLPYAVLRFGSGRAEGSGIAGSVLSHYRARCLDAVPPTPGIWMPTPK